MSGFNNFDCTIGNQVIGTVNINTTDSHKGFVHQQLAQLLAQIQADNHASKIDIQNALHAIAQIKQELAETSPKTETIERSLSVIENVVSVTALVDQIRLFLKDLF
jgi:hypothetical protein